VLDEAEAHGKHLFLAFGEHTVHIHLGLAGKLSFGHSNGNERTVRWRLETEAERAELRGPAACRLLTPSEVDHLQDRLGPDPLRDDAAPDTAWPRIRRSRRAVGALLMDQAVLSGVGNIYRAEVLFRRRIDPFMEGRLLKRSEWQAIWDDLANLMRLGVEVGRIDTVYPEHEPEAMGRPPRQDPHGGEVYVYRRNGQPCLDLLHPDHETATRQPQPVLVPSLPAPIAASHRREGVALDLTRRSAGPLEPAT
jgi:endonuclease VIII